LYCKNIVQESAITLTTISSKFDCCFLINHSLKNMYACNNVSLRQPYSYFIRHLLLICGLYVCPKLIAYLWGTYSCFKERNENNVSDQIPVLKWETFLWITKNLGTNFSLFSQTKFYGEQQENFTRRSATSGYKKS
jgi:hypothetical protein